ncbi:MAG: ABC transporter substrate-binding protein [Desulfobacterales bacterium S5133MH4]|jgi:zinc transport system substrate-binding protein|nr:MAG: ABC transporter substrate-binding protein [Desulfobacterales bacterium S5133MH4]
MKRAVVVILMMVAVVSAKANPAVAGKKLCIGITLHPYYSFVKNIVGDRAEVVPLIGAGFNPHSYEPQPDDIRRVMKMDVIVVNGIGHDDFVFEIIEAARMKDKLDVIFANKAVALIPIPGTDPEDKIVDSHTFVSITTSIQQIYNICAELIKLDPENAQVYRKNTRNYASRLRRIKAEYMKRLADMPDIDFRCASIHGGYSYLLQEFGLEITAVIEPRHGLKPTASQLRATIDLIREANVGVVFSEMNFPNKFVDTIQEATGVRLYTFSHITGGEYRAEKYEDDMIHNLESLTMALIDAYGPKEDKSDAVTN